jgi:hypothetical protein
VPSLPGYPPVPPPFPLPPLPPLPSLPGWFVGGREVFNSAALIDTRQHTSSCFNRGSGTSPWL